jgi:TonB family protein
VKHTSFGNSNLKLGWVRRGLRPAVVLALVLGTFASVALAADRAVKSRVSPMYPEIAKRMRISGMVKLELTVDAEGKVVAVKILEGNTMLGGAAEDAVKKWKFVPGDGVDTVQVSLNFALAQ